MNSDLDAINIARQARSGWLADNTQDAAYVDVYAVLLAANVMPSTATASQWLVAVRTAYSAIEQRIAASINEAEYA